MEHGNKGIISIGAGQGSDASAEVGKTAAGAKLGAYQALVAGLQNKFNADAEICLIGCYVGQGTEGQNLVNCLAADIGGGIKVKAKKGAVSFPLRVVPGPTAIHPRPARRAGRRAPSLARSS